MMNDTKIDVMTAIYGRRAIRAFTGERLDTQTIEKLIGAAIQAPNYMGLQRWAFAIVEGADRLRGFSAEAKQAFVPPSHLHVSEHARSTLNDPNVNIFHDAPALIVICATDDDPQSVEDCSLAAQNLMLAAYAAGLGTCPIGFSRPWLRLAETKKRLGIPDAYVPAFPLVVGHPAEHPDSPGRKAPQIFLTA
ncbi:MAG TPA: nitroreductase family protein [Candidatus Acidoferrales bacterium]|nr:nitroreductase family protein [Candidatus Acidoferrales bacterium]